MDVSNYKTNSCGQELIETVITMTGLPEPLIRTELDQIIENAGQNAGELTLEQLREAMVAYLESLQAALIEEGSLVDD